MKRILLILFCSLHSILFLRSQNASSDIIFKQFFDNAVAFADTYPREKVYLHFDNSSYYVGDTIWFKAYTVYAENNMPSTISKPLYVEMLDQTGHITQRQIIELNSGEGHGQIILNESTCPAIMKSELTPVGCSHSANLLTSHVHSRSISLHKEKDQNGGFRPII